MITYEYDGERLADNSACAGIRADLKICLLQSDCCRKVVILLGHSKYQSASYSLILFSGTKNTKRMLTKK